MDIEPLFERWRLLMKEAGTTCPEQFTLETFQKIVEAYREPHRYYHVLEHIVECLREFDAVRNLANNPVAVELALWFHDAIYVLDNRRNEQQSATWAGRFCREAGLKRYVPIIRGMILATDRKTQGQARTPDEKLVADIDIAGLGHRWEEFEANSFRIRKECLTAMPEKQFLEAEKKMMGGFLSQSSIYQTEYFFQKYEDQAISNIRKYLKNLEAAS